jgi:hypothetical protein
MADLREIFANVGIVPGARMAPSISQFTAENPFAREAYIGSLQQEQNQLEAAAGLGFNQEVSAAYESPTSATVRKFKQAEEDSYGWGDLLGDVTDVLDTLASYTRSGVRELGEAYYGSRLGEALNDQLNLVGLGKSDWERQVTIENNRGSWNDFLTQGREHATTKDFINQVSPDAPGWVKTTAGIVGDIALDPLTYIPIAGTTKIAAKQAVTAGDKALLRAVESAGRNQIAEALAVKATEVGLQADDAVVRLIKGAAQRGRGGLTRGAIERAGLDAAKIEALNLPSLERAFLSMRIPKSRIAAEAAEATKGALKKVLGETSAANWYRTIKITDLNGERAMVGILRGKEQDLKKIWAAVSTLGLDDKAMIGSRGWGTRIAARMMKDVESSIGKVSDEASVSLTHAVEQGIDDVGAKAFGNTFNSVADEMVARGLMTADQVIPNYVPHYTTKEAMAFGKGGSAEAKEVQRFISKVSDSAGFLQERTLTAQDTFLGRTLETGSIQEINGISSEFGFKMFEDDIREITVRYLGTAQNEIGRDIIRKGLVDAGVATDKGIVRSLSDDELKQMAEATAQAKSVRTKIDDLRGKSFNTRKKVISDGKKAVLAERRVLSKEITRLENQVKDIGRKRVTLASKVTKAEEELASYQSIVDVLQRQLDNQGLATEAKLAAQVDLKKAVAKFDNAKVEYYAAKDELESFLQKHTALARPSEKRTAASGRLNSAKNQKALVEGLPAREENLNELQSALIQARKRIDDIEADIGIYDFELEQMLPPRPKAVKALEKPQKQLDTLVNAKSANLAEIGQIDSLVLKNENVVKNIDAVRQQLDEVLARTPYKGRKASSEAIGELKERGQELSDSLKQIGNSYVWADGTNATRPLLEAVDAMARDEGLAWIYDAKQIILGRKQDTLEDLIRTMKDPNFGSLIEYKLHNGMASLTESKQIPQWLDEALQVQVKIVDPEFLPGLQKFLEKFNSLWKAYALARPGAVARNAMGSGTNVYLDRGIEAIGSVNDFMKFHVMFKKNPEGYLDDALKVWSKEEVDMMDRAMSIVSGSGGGQSLVETERNLLNPGTWNPVNKDFKALHVFGKANEEVETILRGGHAYDVLKSGGSDSLALATVEKWHFNYRDITNFDRRMKKVFPFWMFFSRNTALQAHVWTHSLRRLNQYMRIRRNIEGGQSDPLAPDWVTGSGAIGVNFNPKGNTTYMDIGLPPFDFIRNIQEPQKILGNINPLIKLPIEGIFNKNLNTGGNFNNVRDAGLVYGTLGRIPGVSAFFEDTGSGDKAITPFKLQVINSLLPGLANASRLGGGTPKAAWPAWVSYFTGVSFSQVTPEMREAQLRAAERELSAAEYKKKMLEEM